MTVNKVILVGNLGQNPETRTTSGGTTVANLSLATKEKQKDKSGNWIDATEWHRVILYGKLAENAEKYLVKGSQVYIEGRLQTRKWQDKQGAEKQTTEIIAQDMRFIGSRKEKEAASKGSTSDYNYGDPSGEFCSDDDIPF